MAFWYSVVAVACVPLGGHYLRRTIPSWPLQTPAGNKRRPKLPVKLRDNQKEEVRVSYM